MKEVTIETVEQDPCHIEAGNECYGCVFNNSDCILDSTIDVLGLPNCDSEGVIYKIKEK